MYFYYSTDYFYEKLKRGSGVNRITAMQGPKKNNIGLIGWNDAS